MPRESRLVYHVNPLFAEGYVAVNAVNGRKNAEIA
jgi:hypothetical protein